MTYQDNYLKCEWCDTNASTTIRTTYGKLTGICLEHLSTVPTARVAGTLIVVSGPIELAYA